jgi:putative phosphoesterase
MRIAVLSDVHGNLRALDAVTDDLRRQAPDLVVHGGDLALNGPRPAEVVDRIRELGWPGARGNADELLWAGLAPVPAAEREHARALRQATLRLLGPDRVQWLRQLPRLWRHEDLVVMHASPTTVEEAPPVEATDRQLVETYGGLAARLVVYAHLPRPFVRRIGSLTVANTGSVGWPVDGDWRPSYLLIDDGEVRVRRVRYDVQAQIAELRASTYPSRSWLVKVHQRAESVRPLELDAPTADGERPVTWDSNSPRVTARAHRGPAVPDAMRTQDGPG